MRTNLKKFSYLLIILLSFGLTALFAQGMGGGQHGGGHGGHGGPGGGDGPDWPPDSANCDSSGPGWGHDGPGWDWDSTGHDSSGHWGHHGPGHGWGPGDSTACDSSVHGGQHGWHPGGGHHGPGQGWSHGDSLTLESILVSGVISTLTDTIIFGGEHGFPGAPDSGEFIRTRYFLDANADAIADYRLLHLRRLSHTDSTFVLPVEGDLVSVSGLLLPAGDQLQRLIVLSLTPAADPDVIGALLAVNSGQISEHHRLEARNYPNPFNPSTVIEFYLAQSEHTSLKIYDIRGSEVAVLAEGQLQAGEHRLTFTPGNLSAGTYLYVLEASGQREVRRIAYLK
jgi:hypothetical protein